jgi:hypothetical protein
MGAVEEECDESIYWMELLIESGRIPAKRTAALLQEDHEILAMTVASLNTAKSHR